MSVKVELYNLVKTAVLAIPGIETFGHFNNQFDTEADEQPFNTPAVFIEFNSVSWQPSMLQATNPQGAQQQKSDALQFTLHIAYWSHEEEEDKFLGLMDLVDSVYRAIANIESENINPLQRVDEIDDNAHREPIVWQTVFQTMVTEQGLEKQVSPVTPEVIVLNSNI